MPNGLEFQPVISDSRGNILGAVNNGAVSWNTARPTGFGAIPNCRPLPLGHGGDIVQSSAWRGRYADITGLTYLGGRYYDPIAARFMTPDPIWNARDPNFYSFCGGDPINRFDADGRLGKGFYQSVEGAVTGTAGLLWNVGGSIGYGATSIFSQEAANDIYGGQWQGLKNTGSGLAYLAGQVSEGNFNTVGTALTGGEDKSGFYRAGNVLGTIGTIWAGGELGEVGNVGRGAEMADAGVQAAKGVSTLGTTTYDVSFASTGSRVLDSVGLQNAKIANIGVTIDPSLTGANLANVTAHEGFHVAVAQSFPNFAASSGRLPFVGAFPLYAEEVGAYGYGAISSGQYGQALFAPISAFGSMSAGQTASVLGTGAAVGGLWYYSQH
jgi:RHS repeat-associated protein